MFYVNLPLRFIADDARWLELFLGHRKQWLQDRKGPELGLELGVDAYALEQLPLTWHEDLVARLREVEAPRAFHLPFQDLSPGSSDAFIRRASIQRLGLAFDLAELYAPAHMVGHPIYNAESYNDNAPLWVENCAAGWLELMDAHPGHAPVFLENIFEQKPEPLALLMQALAGHDVGICFDVGHWHSFARGHKRQNLTDWVRTLGPWIRHLHLHDNDGSWDQHLGLGKGRIDFSALFALLREVGARPGATFEPHDEEAFRQTLGFMHSKPDLFAALG